MPNNILDLSLTLVELLDNIPRLAFNFLILILDVDVQNVVLSTFFHLNVTAR